MSITSAQFAEGWPAFREASARALRSMPTQLPQPSETDTCAQCGATGELQLTVYDRWQRVDLSGCARRQLAARRL